MFLVENNNITITKGDSGKFDLKFLNDDGTEYFASDTDKVVFSVKKTKDKFSPLIMAKTGEKIVLDAKETEQIPSGNYVYDVVIETNAGERYTAIEGEFIVRKAVHEFER